jgi:hypothetical protein
MRELVEPGRVADPGRGPVTRGSRGLRLVGPGTSDVPSGWRREAAGQDHPAQMNSAGPHLVLVGGDEAQPERLAANVVMRQLLDAWRSAERQLASVAAGSPEMSQIEAHAATLRMLYQGLFAHVLEGQPERRRI